MIRNLRINLSVKSNLMSKNKYKCRRKCSYFFFFFLRNISNYYFFIYLHNIDKKKNKKKRRTASGLSLIISCRYRIINGYAAPPSPSESRPSRTRNGNNTPNVWYLFYCTIIRRHYYYRGKRGVNIFNYKFKTNNSSTDPYSILSYSWPRLNR